MLNKSDVKIIADLIFQSEQRIEEKIDQKIDSLAVVTKNSFDYLDGKIDSVTSNLDDFRLEVNNRFDQAEFTMTTFYARLDKTEDNIRQLKTKVGLK
jgi:hypothetical protein